MAGDRRLRWPRWSCTAAVAAVLTALCGMPAGAAPPTGPTRLLFSVLSKPTCEGYVPSALYTAEPDGSRVRRLSGATDSDITPAWSPDGTRIAYVHAEIRGCQIVSRGVWIMNADGSRRRMILNAASQPVWAPDGRRLAFIVGELGRGELGVVDTDGSRRRTILATPQSVFDPAWSPDGKNIAVVDAATRQILVVGVDDLRITAVTPAVAAGQPSWSPDGRQLTFLGLSARGQYTIWVSGVAPGSAHDLGIVADGRSPQWSPDGHRILYSRSGFSYGRFDSRVKVVDADGTHERDVTPVDEPAYDLTPSWSPDGKWVAFTAMTATRNGVAPRGQWIMRSDGRDRRPVASVGSTFGWFGDGPVFAPR